MHIKEQEFIDLLEVADPEYPIILIDDSHSVNYMPNLVQSSEDKWIWSCHIKEEFCKDEYCPSTGVCKEFLTSSTTNDDDLKEFYTREEAVI